MALTDAEKAAADAAEHARALQLIQAVRAARQADQNNPDRPKWAVRHRRFPEIFQFHTEAAARGLVTALVAAVPALAPGLDVLNKTTDGWEVAP